MAITNQRIIIEKWLLDYGTITQKQANDDLHISRLAPIISVLIKRGVPIITKYHRVKNHYGRMVRIAEYTIDRKTNPKTYMDNFNDIVERTVKKWGKNNG